MLNNQLQGKYAELVNQLLIIYNLEVVKINKGMYGTAYTKKNQIEIPHPKTEKSLSICLHEIGHKALNHNNGLRFIEEWEAWNFSLKLMKDNNIPIKKNVRNRFKKSIKYAIDKAMRRGLNPKTISKEIKRLIK